MKNQKFKVGDRVRIVRGCVTGLDGTLGTILEIDEPSIPYCVNPDALKNNTARFWCVEVERAKQKKHPVIVITSDGKTTTATMRQGKKVLKTATAQCSDKDVFDFAEGARIAFERLQWRDPFQNEETKPNIYSGKFVCIDVKGNGIPYTVGKVYRCEKGRMFNSDHNKESCCYFGFPSNGGNRFRVGFSCGEAVFAKFLGGLK